MPFADSLVVVARAEEMPLLKRTAEMVDGCDPVFAVGGETRQESVSRGLEALSWADDDDLVLVHDGARPALSACVVRRCLEGARSHHMAAAALPVSDTLQAATDDGVVLGTVERTGLWSMQTPQVARLAVLRDAFALACADGFIGTDEASLVARLPGARIQLVEGAPENIKVTTPADARFAGEWLSLRDGAMRVGIGYDIHRLVPGRPLMLGGIEIPSDAGLMGHSDADALLHAICDALLGAAGMPDIGQLFPDTDAKYEGLASLRFLEQVAKRLADAGWRAGNVDSTVIAQRPKIAPFAGRMRAAIAGALDINESCVAVKATTNEGLDALGAGEGIACYATASIISIRGGKRWQ